jgi:hypothetical protein
MHFKAFATALAAFVTASNASPVLSSTAASTDVSSSAPASNLVERKPLFSPFPSTTGSGSTHNLGNPEGLHVVMGDETFVFRGFSHSHRGTPLSYPGLMPQLLESFRQIANGVLSDTLRIGGIDVASWQARQLNLDAPILTGHSLGGAVAAISAVSSRATDFDRAAGQITFYTYGAPKSDSRVEEFIAEVLLQTDMDD